MIKPGMEWPPKPYTPALRQIAHDSAWVAGDLHQIRAHTPQPAPRPYTSRAQFNGGALGAVARGVLGRPHMGGSATVERHLPIVQELVEAKGSMMLGSPPAITVHPDDESNTHAVEALARMTGTDEYAAELTHMGNRLSGLGWSYGRVKWNTEVAPDPWLEWVDADNAMPEFQWGRCVAVHFWDTYRHDKHVYRLVESHRPGHIEYRLYRGKDDNLGMVVPYQEIPETEHLASVGLTEDGIKPTNIPWMTAGLINNRDRNPRWRHDPLLRYMGMSDVQAAGGLLADIDKAYTELWHEIDSGRARLLISDGYLQNTAPGSGQVFDWWRDVYPLAPGAGADEPGRIERVQFDLRTKQYLDALEVPILRAVGAWGLSAITMDLDSSAASNMTATEIRAKSNRTLNTFRNTARHIRAGLSILETARLSITANIHGFKPPTRPVNVALVEPVHDTELDRAKTVEAWHASGSASLLHRVRTLHPELDEAQIEAEYEQIWAEKARESRLNAAVDPFLLTSGPDQPIED